MYKKNATHLTGNDIYEGFCIDLLDAISDRLDFKFIIKEVKGNSYGRRDAHGKWNGAIGALSRWVNFLLCPKMYYLTLIL